MQGRGGRVGILEYWRDVRRKSDLTVAGVAMARRDS
jgi:hypothetical protein